MKLVEVEDHPLKIPIVSKLTLSNEVSFSAAGHREDTQEDTGFAAEHRTFYSRYHSVCHPRFECCPGGDRSVNEICHRGDRSVNKSRLGNGLAPMVGLNS